MPVTLTLRAFATGIGPLTAKVLADDATTETDVELSEVGALGVYRGVHNAAPHKSYDAGVTLPNGDRGHWAYVTDADGNAIVPATAADIVNPAGSGARSVVIAVVDADTDDPLSGAHVRLRQGVETWVDETDEDGLAYFEINDGTYSVSITRSMYTFAGASLVVNGDEDREYEMSATVLPMPANPGYSACRVITYDGAGVPAAGVTIEFQLTESDGAPGASYPRTIFPRVSDEDGLLSVDLPREFEFQARRIGPNTIGPWVPFTVDDNEYMELPAVLGQWTDTPE